MLNKRSTIAPQLSRRSTMSASTMKSRQLAHLNSQIAQLQANMCDLDNLLRVTAVQAEYIRKLGLMHGSLFMAGHRVFEEQALRNQRQEDDEEEGRDEETI